MRVAFDAALDALASKHAATFLLVYPQDDDDDAAEGVEDLGGWDWRHRALIRLYERELGFNLLENKEAPFGVTTPRCCRALYLALQSKICGSPSRQALACVEVDTIKAAAPFGWRAGAPRPAPSARPPASTA